MPTNRLPHLFPAAPAAAPGPTALMACPLAVMPGYAGWHGAWQQVYAVAFAQAQAVVRPSRLDRLQAHLDN